MVVGDSMTYRMVFRCPVCGRLEERLVTFQGGVDPIYSPRCDDRGPKQFGDTMTVPRHNVAIMSLVHIFGEYVP